MQFILLTHTRELNKASATGPLVKSLLQQDCHIIEWQRKAPSTLLLALEPTRSALVYLTPTDKVDSITSVDASQLQQIDTFVILDGTWQEANKMYNRSPYLQALPHYTLTTDRLSAYCLRRNQKATGLCTAEVVIELLQSKQEVTLAHNLEQAFNRFNTKNGI